MRTIYVIPAIILFTLIAGSCDPGKAPAPVSTAIDKAPSSVDGTIAHDGIEVNPAAGSSTSPNISEVTPAENDSGSMSAYGHPPKLVDLFGIFRYPGGDEVPMEFTFNKDMTFSFSVESDTSAKAAGTFTYEETTGRLGMTDTSGSEMWRYMIKFYKEAPDAAERDHIIGTDESSNTITEECLGLIALGGYYFKKQ